MKHRTALTWIVVAGLTFGTVVACGHKPPPAPAPQGPTPEELAQMRADSIRRAQAAAEARQRAEQARRQAEQERQAAIQRAKDVLQQRVFFDYDKSDIKPQAQQVLQEKAQILRASPQVQLRLEGNADERGSNEYNMALGARRAEAVKNFFVSFGLNADRFTTVSYGEERPLVQGHNEQAWAKNRRVEFVITAGSDQVNPATSSQ